LASKIPVAYIEVRVFAHATEDEEKVLAAVRNTLPPQVSESITFKRSSLKGHHGNPIVLFEARIRDREQARAFMQKLASSLSSLDKEVLAGEIERHIDRGCLYLRLDKQSAYLNEIRLCATDPIHFRIHFKRADLKEITAFCREIGLIP
jgi:RNA binding exosome subunit